MLRNQSERPDLIVRTSARQWVVPHDCRFLRLLVEQQNLRADDLRFISSKECHEFTRALFLLSFEDEQISQKISPLAILGRELASMSAAQI